MTLSHAVTPSIPSHVVKHWQINHISTKTTLQNEQFTLSRSVQVGWYSCFYHVSVGTFI